MDYIRYPPLIVKLTLGSIVAIGLHHGLFIRGEWHLHSLSILMMHILAFVTYITTLFIVEECSMKPAVVEAVLIFTTYLVALFTSIAIYRLLFHRLSRAGFPGPPLARITKFWHAWACRDSRNFLVLDELASKYGDFVRTGPSELTITHPDVYQGIDGPGNACTKADWYDITHPYVSLLMARDKKFHDQRRRIWDQGFSSKALAQYRQRTLNHVRMLQSRIAADAAADRPTSADIIFSWFSFDVMGDFVFGTSFNMLQQRQWHAIITRLRDFLGLLGPMTPLPWLAHLGFRLAKMLPSATGEWFDMVRWCRQQMKDRAKSLGDEKQKHATPVGTPDVSSSLLAEARKNGSTEKDWQILGGDTVLAIVAGSDTVSTTLSSLFYRLATNPTTADRLHAELVILADNCIEDDSALAQLPYLNGAINETLRLHPAIPTGGLRKTGKRGAVIGGRWIPGETTIAAPRWSVFRREDCFENASAFIPERWCEKPEMIKSKRGFKPFGTGRHACIGRSLALSELRLVTAALVLKYHVELAALTAGGTGQPFLEGMQDCFVARTGPLELRFRGRETEEGQGKEEEEEAEKDEAQGKGEGMSDTETARSGEGTD